MQSHRRGGGVLDLQRAYHSTWRFLHRFLSLDVQVKNCCRLQLQKVQVIKGIRMVRKWKDSKGRRRVDSCQQTIFQMASQLLDYKLDSLPNCSVFRNYLAIRLDPEISRSLKYIQCSFAWWLLGCKCLLEFSNVLTATWFTYIHAYILEILYIYLPLMPNPRWTDCTSSTWSRRSRPPSV